MRAAALERGRGEIRSPRESRPGAGPPEINSQHHFEFMRTIIDTLIDLAEPEVIACEVL